MTHHIEPESHYIAGTSTEWSFEITDDGTTKDLSGASATWHLLPTRRTDANDALLDDTADGVSLTLDETTGTVSLSIDRDVTTDLAGSHWQRLVVDDAMAGRRIWHGPFPIRAP